MYVLSFLDTESPVFKMCPQYQIQPIVPTAPEQAAGVVVWDDPKAVDNSNQEPIITCIPMSGKRLPVGQMNVNCTAQDKSGNTAECNFIVDVQGN